MTTVKEYWNNNPCGAITTSLEPHTKSYYDAIEIYRYNEYPLLPRFANFSNYKDKKVLEIGVGMGTDFIQWIRNGTKAYGIDLAERSIIHTNERLKLEGLKAERLEVGNAEYLPYEDNQFDLVYSFGVIHHADNPTLIIKEIAKVAKPNGEVKLMLYNRHSILAICRWLFWCIADIRVQSISTVISKHQESPGTKAYTIKEVKSLLNYYGLKPISISAPVMKRDLNFHLLFKPLSYLLLALFGKAKGGWCMLIEAKKI